MTTPLLDYPWQVVGSDLFWLKGEQYLLVVDYFSRFPEVVKMSSTVSVCQCNICAEITVCTLWDP